MAFSSGASDGYLSLSDHALNRARANGAASRHQSGSARTDPAVAINCNACVLTPARIFEEQAMTYRGSCHCGAVAYEVEGEINGAISCNCSICQRKGSLLWFVPREAMQLLSPEENSRVYEFNRHRIRHRFCPTC